MQHQYHPETLVDLCSFYAPTNNDDASEYTQYRKRAKNKKIYPLRQQKNYRGETKITRLHKIYKCNGIRSKNNCIISEKCVVLLHMNRLSKIKSGIVSKKNVIFRSLICQLKSEIYGSDLFSEKNCLVSRKKKRLSIFKCVKETVSELIIIFGSVSWQFHLEITGSKLVPIEHKNVEFFGKHCSMKKFHTAQIQPRYNSCRLRRAGRELPASGSGAFPVANARCSGNWALLDCKSQGSYKTKDVCSG